MKKIAILQSNYIPWKGYFDIIGSVDEFIVYDEVQYTKNDWRNRNKIKAKNDLLWLTIPVAHNARFGQRINEARISDRRWPKKHCQSLKTYYAKAPFFDMLFPSLENVYDACKDEEFLSAINLRFLYWVLKHLNIMTRISSSLDYPSGGDKIARLVNVCTQAKANIYLSGPSAKAYINEGLFTSQGIQVMWMDYSGYKEYPQLHGGVFRHDVTILDLLFNVGPKDAKEYIKSTQSQSLDFSRICR